jgi:hypothetical protein
LDSKYRRKEANLAEIAAKGTEMLTDVILMALLNEQSTLMADSMAHFGDFAGEKRRRRLNQSTPIKPGASAGRYLFGILFWIVFVWARVETH